MRKRLRAGLRIAQRRIVENFRANFEKRFAADADPAVAAAGPR